MSSVIYEKALKVEEQKTWTVDCNFFVARMKELTLFLDRVCFAGNMIRGGLSTSTVHCQSGKAFQS